MVRGRGVIGGVLLRRGEEGSIVLDHADRIPQAAEPMARDEDTADHEEWHEQWRLGTSGAIAS